MQIEAPEAFNLAALQSGDRAEFARLVETYSGVIYRLAARMLDDAQDAEDVLQETFLKAYRSLPRFDGRARLSTWLYRIATNEALMTLRKRKKIVLPIDEPDDDEPEARQPLQIVDFCCLPEEDLMSAEARHHLDQAIDRLPANLRVAFLLRDIEGLSTQETADILRLSESAVKTRLSRARLRLRDLLSEYFKERVDARQIDGKER